MDKTKRKQGDEAKAKDERKRRTENERKEPVENIAALREQKIGEESKLIKELRKENKKLKSNISCMQSDIADKNSKIAQLTIANMKLATRNSYITEIRTKDKLYKKERGTESEEED